MKNIFILLLLALCLQVQAYECDGRTRCGQMTSCEEATWFLQHCPGTTMDGDNDGVPCEKQWCNGDLPSFHRNTTTQQKNNAVAPAQPEFHKSGSDDPVSRAFRDHQDNVQVFGRGVVVNVLADDTNGTRHQRFILRTDSGATVLVVHNIDLAPRLPDLNVGDEVRFYGEYVWGEQGGTIHWTHHDPQGAHVAGWLQYKGGKYQ